MKPYPGTYALLLQSHSTETIQVGRWGKLDLQPGYYLYVGSAFGPGGVQARVSRHLRTDVRVHWHIDHLRKHVTPREVWVDYATKHLEHEWAGIFFDSSEMTAFRGIGCSDCTCYSHLFYTPNKPDINRFSGRMGSMVEVLLTRL